MKIYFLGSLLTIAILYSGATAAMGQFTIEIKEVTTGQFSVELISSSADFYNKRLPNTFDSRKAAQDAAKQALLDISHTPKADSEDNPCGFFQSDLL